MVNVSLLFLSRFVTLIGSPVIGLLVVRYLGQDTYGQYAAALAITGLFGFLSDFGVQQTILRFGARAGLLGPVLKRGSLVSLAYTGIAVTFILVWMSIFSYDSLVRKIVAIQCVGLVRTPLLTLVTAGLQLKGEYGRIAFWNFSTTLVQWAGTLGSMAAGWSVLLLTAIPIALSMALVLVMTVTEGRRLSVHEQPGLAPDLSSFLRESWKFGTAGTMYQIYHKGDSAILSAARPPIEVGHYSVAMRMAEMANVIPGIVFNQILYPKYFRWSQQQRERFQTFYSLTAKLMLVLGANVGAFMIMFGRDLVRFLFGMDDAMFSFMIPALAIGVMLHFWAAAPGAVLTTDGYVGRKIWIQGFTATVSLLLNSLLIPVFGAAGAAGVFALSQLLLGVLYTRELILRTGFMLFDVRWKSITFFGFVIVMVLASSILGSLCWIWRGVVQIVVGIISLLSVWVSWLTKVERSEITGFLSRSRSRSRSSLL